MRSTLENRLQTLRAEYKSGQTMLTELEAKQTNLRTTLLRISGAIQVLEELIQEEQEGADLSPDAPAEPEPTATKPLA